MLHKIKGEMLNLGLKFISVDEKLIRMILETGSSNINEIVILPAVKMVMKKIVKKLQNKIIHGRVHNGILNGVKVSVIRSQIGCPNMAMVKECLKRSKAKIVIRLDFCGGIGNEQNIAIGDVLIPNVAFCDDGTSPQYIRNYPSLLNQLDSIENPLSLTQNLATGNQTIFMAKPNNELKDIIMKEAHDQGKSVKDAKLWTIDALFCETFDFVKSLRTIGIQAIDMESSILFLLGQLYNLKTVSILSVSDLPQHPKYDMMNSNEIHPNMEKGIEDAIKLVTLALPKIQSIKN